MFYIDLSFPIAVDDMDWDCSRPMPKVHNVENDFIRDFRIGRFKMCLREFGFADFFSSPEDD
jgi:hypothetical protein